MSTTYEVGLGEHIERALAEMTKLATERGVTVTAKFNGTNITARPGDVPNDLLDKWSADRARGAEAVAREKRGKPWYITERASWWNTTCLLVWIIFRRRTAPPADKPENATKEAK